MTNGWIDIKNTDMMLIMGGNPAENHPCGFKWAVEAKRNRNAKIIVVDPRFTRTARSADLFCQIRAGSDIAFLGGVINYAMENNRIAKDYLVNYTNAAFIVKEGFKLPEDGLFSGFDAATKTYNKSSWNYQEGGNETGKVVPVSGAATPAEGHEAKAAVMPVSSCCERRGEYSTSSAVASAERRLRPVIAASALRLSTAETAVFPLYARDGRAHYRNTERPVPESCGPVHLHSQERRHEEGRHHHLRGGLDAA